MGSPRWSQRSSLLPFETFRCVPSANQSMTNRMSPIAIDGPNASSGGMPRTIRREPSGLSARLAAHGGALTRRQAMDELVRGEPTPPGGGRRSPVAGLREALAEVVYGMTGYEVARPAIETRASLEKLFLGVVVGRIVGPPGSPPSL